MKNVFKNVRGADLVKMIKMNPEVVSALVLGHACQFKQFSGVWKDMKISKDGYLLHHSLGFDPECYRVEPIKKKLDMRIIVDAEVIIDEGEKSEWRTICGWLSECPRVDGITLDCLTCGIVDRHEGVCLREEVEDILLGDVDDSFTEIEDGVHYLLCDKCHSNTRRVGYNKACNCKPFEVSAEEPEVCFQPGTIYAQNAERAVEQYFAKNSNCEDLFQEERVFITKNEDNVSKAVSLKIKPSLKYITRELAYDYEGLNN